jgi:hypothetical protein
MKSERNKEEIEEKLDLILFNQSKNRELTDLSNLENTNFAIFISVLALFITIVFGLKLESTEKSIIPYFITIIIVYIVGLIFVQIYLIYKNDIRSRFNFFYLIIIFLFSIIYFPFFVFFMNYYFTLYNINYIWWILTILIFIIVFGFIKIFIIQKFFIPILETKLSEKFPILYLDTSMDSVIELIKENMNIDELLELYIALENNNKKEIKKQLIKVKNKIK